MTGVPTSELTVEREVRHGCSAREMRADENILADGEIVWS